MIQPINVTYKATSSAYVANQWLRSLPELIACDFETAVKYTPEQLASFQKQLDAATTMRERIHLESLVNATALDHPSKVDITHFQVAWSESEAYVFILDNKRIHDLVLYWLVTTDRKQIWHNASFDFKHIHYHTGKFPRDYEDSALMAKSILNHVETNRAKVGLKELASKWYGSWAISPDHFTKDQMYDPQVLLYAATDPCATFKLYKSIRSYCESSRS